MKAETNRGTLYMEFQHVFPRVGGKLLGGSVPEFQNKGDAGTYCLIRRDDARGDIVGQGRSIIHENDKYSYNREKGRKIALRNALRNMALGRAGRTAMWEAYLNR